MRGVAPIRRTAKYLADSPVIFKNNVKIMVINYNEPVKHLTRKTSYPNHEGIKEFVFWTLPKIQYKNENMQIVTLKNMTPSPFITCYMRDGSKVIFDIDNQSKDTIIERLNKTLGKTEETLAEEAFEAQKKDNPANFGYKCRQYCMCSIPGQVHCPGFMPLPKKWRGKIVFGDQADED